MFVFEACVCAYMFATYDGVVMYTGVVEDAWFGPILFTPPDALKYET